MTSTSSMHRRPRRKLGRPVEGILRRMKSRQRLLLSMQLMSSLPAALGAQVDMKCHLLLAVFCCGDATGFTYGFRGL